MKAKTIQIHKPKTLASILQELDLYEEKEMFFFSVDDVKESNLERVVSSTNQVQLIPTVSGGSEDSFSIIDSNNIIQIGNSYEPLQEELRDREDKMALQLDKRLFIKELEQYAKPGFDVEALVDSNRCAKCRSKLHLPQAWRHMSLKVRRKYFKALVILEQTEVILCCSCYAKVNVDKDTS